MKILSGAEIADYMKENQAHKARNLKARKVQPRLVIIRDSDNPVIMKYVTLKQRYGDDIGVVVEDWLVSDVAEAIEKANQDPSVHGVIVQLPLQNKKQADAILQKIAPEKDVDGLARAALAMQKDAENYSSGDIISSKSTFESATATAINWLLAGYDVRLDGKKIALVGRGRLVGAPLERMWQDSGYDVTVFRSHSDLNQLAEFDVIVSATGVPHLIKDEMIKPGVVIVDAGTASEDGVLVGDVDEAVREDEAVAAMTPKVGGVGPLTVTALFEHVLMAAERNAKA